MRSFSQYFSLQGPRIVSHEIPGERSRTLIEALDAREGNIVSYPRKMPIAIKRASGAFVEDEDGNVFLDFFAGCGVLNVGHSNEFVLGYVKAQQEKLVHALDFPTANKLELIEKIFAFLPEAARDQYRINFCGPSGSDAVEAAVKLAKHKTGRRSVIAFQGSYHGMTSGALSFTSNTTLRDKLNGLLPYVHFIPYSYCYRCPFGKENKSCQLECADYLKYILDNPHSGIERPAAILVEPIQGEGGTIVPREGFLERIVQTARRYQVPVIFDEIQSGFFRSGTFFSFEQAGVLPDIITLSKGLGGIGFPISAILYKKELESWQPGDHIGTFRCNQVSIAAGNGALDFMNTHELGAHTAEMGQYLLADLQRMAGEHPYIGEVRGRGLFIGIEYVSDKLTREPFARFVQFVRRLCLEKGLLFEVGGHHNNVIRFIPPLIIDQSIADTALHIFRQANFEALNHVDAVELPNLALSL